jgi:hypothetical protein
MLIEFKVANFRSIREEQTFSLVAENSDKDLPACVIDPGLPGLSGVRFLKGAAIYGANASGKSNILKALQFIARFVTRSATKIGPGDPTKTEPFKLDRFSHAKPSVFEITFVARGVRYVFGCSLTPKRVVEEYLVAYPKGSPQRWYHRTYDESTKEYRWEAPSTSFKDDKALQEKTRENSLYLSVGPQFNHAQLLPVFEWFKVGLRFIQLSFDEGLDAGFTAERLANPKHKKRLLQILRSADFGIVDAAVEKRPFNLDEIKKKLPPSVLAEIEKSDAVPKHIVEVKLSHAGEGDAPVPLNFLWEESEGTQRFFALIGPWLDILDHGYTVFVDEIETSIHPILVKELLKLLFCDKNNPKGAQIVFTTHSPVLLDSTLMRRDQVWFTEKSQAGSTHLYPLTDFSPRKGEALAKGYLAGRYGAIPFLTEGLKL